MNTEDDKLAKDSVFPNDGYSSILNDKRKKLFGVVKKVDTFDAAENERKIILIVSNLLTKDLLDREM